MNCDTMTAPSLNMEHLEISQPEKLSMKIPVSDNIPRYKLTLSYQGCKLVIQTPAVEQEGTFYKDNIVGESIILPVSSWLRHQFNILDLFALEVVTVPDDLRRHWQAKENMYKAIYNGKNICVKLSQFCRFTQTVDGQVVDVPCNPRPRFGHGRYSYTLEIPSFYMGPHKAGEMYSLTMFINRVHFESIPNAVAPSCVIPVSQPMNVKPEVSHAMAGLLQTLEDSEMKPKRRRKHVISQ